MPTTTTPPLQTSPDTSVQSTHVPPVLSLVRELPEAASPRIHILGDDLNAKYIAHAMSQMHEHVELLSWSGRGLDERSRNVETKVYEDSERQRRIEPNGARTSRASDSNSHIDHLVLSGNGRSAVPALQSVSHRLDKTSTVCLMNDGLGVLEDVRRRVFNGKDPTFLLGHMSHRISYNRKFDSIREMRKGRMMLTSPWNRSNNDVDSDQLITTDNTLANSLQSTSTLQSSMAGYHEWLRFKMPSIILGAVVDPCCVMFDTTYHGVFKNQDALYIMDTLLQEILTVLDNMPELSGSNMGDFIREPAQRLALLRRLILGRKDQPSPMLQLLRRGGYTDVNYLNGYFIRRGKQLGFEMPRNSMASDLVRGWHRIKVQERDRWIPFNEKPLLIDQRSRLEGNGTGQAWTAPRN